MNIPTDTIELTPLDTTLLACYFMDSRIPVTIAYNYFVYFFHGFIKDLQFSFGQAEMLIQRLIEKNLVSTQHGHLDFSDWAKARVEQILLKHQLDVEFFRRLKFYRIALRYLLPHNYRD